MSKRSKYKKQKLMLMQYHKAQLELCTRKILEIKQTCIELGLMRTNQH